MLRARGKGGGISLTASLCRISTFFVSWRASRHGRLDDAAPGRVHLKLACPNCAQGNFDPYGEVTPQPAVASVDLFASVSVAAPEDLAVISRPFLFISNRCLRSKPLTNSRAALATAPGRLDASTMTVDSLDSSFRSRWRNCTSNAFM